MAPQAAAESAAAAAATATAAAAPSSATATATAPPAAQLATRDGGDGGSEQQQQHLQQHRPQQPAPAAATAQRYPAGSSSTCSGSSMDGSSQETGEAPPAAAAAATPAAVAPAAAAAAVAKPAAGISLGPHDKPKLSTVAPPEPQSPQQPPEQQQQQQPLQGWSPGRRLGMTLAAPLLAAYCCAAFGAAWLLTCTILPSYVLAQRLYWACPFIPHIWARLGPVAGTAARLGFEASHCINILTRLLTLPLRPHLPAFYILGFPKCGTTSLAEHLKHHPGLSATAGLPYHEALAKESHFFQGVYGRTHAHSRTLYRSCFPTVLTRWWHEVVRGAPAWACFDACPVNVCMPHTAERIRRLTPEAKFVVMLRDPVPGVFSAEIMMRDMGVPLTWSLMEPPQGEEDPRFTQVPAEVSALWRRLAALGPEEPLPRELPTTFYTQLGAVLQCGMYADLLRPYLDRFPKDSFMFVEFKQFTFNPEAVVRQVLQFVGMDAARYTHKPLPPAMKNNYGSRAMHPGVRAALARLYGGPGGPNRRLAALLAAWGQLPAELGWMGMEGA